MFSSSCGSLSQLSTTFSSYSRTSSMAGPFQLLPLIYDLLRYGSLRFQAAEAPSDKPTVIGTFGYELRGWTTGLEEAPFGPSHLLWVRLLLLIPKE